MAAVMVVQRYLDAAGTQPYEGHYNVFRGRRYMGVVYYVPGAGWYAARNPGRFSATRDEAVARLVEA